MKASKRRLNSARKSIQSNTTKQCHQQALPGFTFELDSIILGDCLSVMRTFPNECIDLIITSPPYADNRKGSYKGVPIDQYVQWFSPISSELKRILKPEGSFVLNIKERAINSERQTYVLELILEMKKQGWLWVEEYIWHKKNCYPGKWPNRFRDAWERCLHFTKQKNSKCSNGQSWYPWVTGRKSDWRSLAILTEFVMSLVH